jgi:Glyoxalase/Bleomycin resistance protein/Dioxygenase superfamily
VQAGPFGGLHHIGIATWRPGPAEERICALVGGRVVAAGTDDVVAISWSWIEAPGCPILELVSPTGDDGPVARFLRRHGPGLHHLSFRPASVEAARSHVRNCSLGVIGEHVEANGYEQLFVDPGQTAGALFHAFRELD